MKSYYYKIISIFKNESELKKVSRNAKKNLGVSWSEIIKKYYKIYKFYIIKKNSFEWLIKYDIMRL